MANKKQSAADQRNIAAIKAAAENGYIDPNGSSTSSSPTDQQIGVGSDPVAGANRLYDDDLNDPFANNKYNTQEDGKISQQYTNSLGYNNNKSILPTAQSYSSQAAKNSNFLMANKGQNGLNIMGMPLTFSAVDDPRMRVYRNTFEQDLPLVFLNPGATKL